MDNHTAAPFTQDPLDDLLDQLLGFNFVVTHLIDRMLDAPERGRSDSDAEPILDVLRALLRDALSDVAGRFSTVTLQRSARVIEEMLRTAGEEIYTVDPGLDGAGDDELDPGRF